MSAAERPVFRPIPDDVLIALTSLRWKADRSVRTNDIVTEVMSEDLVVALDFIQQQQNEIEMLHRYIRRTERP